MTRNSNGSKAYNHIILTSWLVKALDDWKVMKAITSRLLKTLGTLDKKLSKAFAIFILKFQLATINRSTICIDVFSRHLR